jgi:NADH pyrophosphatase NudC (nudix superfamily)
MLTASAFAADSPYTLELRPSDPASKYTARDAAGRIGGATNIYITQSGTGAVFIARPWSVTNYMAIDYDSLVQNLSDDGATNMVRALVSSGRFCAVRGHVWAQDFGGIVQSIHYLNGAPEVRKCGVCGHQQSRQMGDWK